VIDPSLVGTPEGLKAKQTCTVGAVIGAEVWNPDEGSRDENHLRHGSCTCSMPSPMQTPSAQGRM
jgi:hypothetical protein